MKKILYSLIALSFLAFSARNATAQNRYIGARFGVNLANQAFEDSPPGISNSIRTGILAGLQVERIFSGTWSLMSQVLYDEKGVDESINRSGSEFGNPVTQIGTANLIFHCFEIPVLLKASFGSGGVRPYLFAGPSIGLFLSGREEDHYTVTIPGTPVRVDTTTSDPNSYVKSLDISAVFGAGISVHLISGQILFVDASYALGLSNVAVIFGSSVHSRDIRLAAGILFPLDLPHLF
ncbi:MAG: porin family protein [Candidatus Kapaibacterium sp.]